MYFGIPQIILLGLIVMGLGLNLAKHGEPQKGKHSFWMSLVNSAVIVGLLYWGGFFSI